MGEIKFPLRAHYLQHVSFEGLGCIEPWLQNAGYEISSTPFFQSGVLPAVQDIDLLIVLGGPMSANDETEYPWLVKEKEFIRNAIQAGKPILGICLGAQLIANSMGAAVLANPVKEIGWFPIEGVESDDDTVFQFPQSAEVFHWHGETFNLPKDAILIAKSKGCVNQAFQMGGHVIGLQFHLETTPASARAIIENCRDEIVDGEYIQSEAEILAAPLNHYSLINNLMRKILEHLHKNSARK